MQEIQAAMNEKGVAYDPETARKVLQFLWETKGYKRPREALATMR